jgi:hypothetical protein
MKLTFKQVILYILSGWLILVGIQSATTQALPGGLTPTTPFTGRLINSTGQIVSDGEYRIRVRVFNAESGGTQLFEELFDSQTSYNGQVCPKQKTQNGYFRLEMGSCNILSSDAFKALYNNTSLFIEIAIDFDEDGTYEEVFAPRRRIGIQAGAVSALQLVSDGNGTSTNALSIDGQGHLQFEGIGRLGWGIGGAQPQSTLEVNDATNASRLQLYGAGDGLSFSSIQLGRNTRGSASWFMHHRQIAGETGNLAIEEFDGTNYNQRLTIRPGGNVGIGTTAPTARLQVQGSGTTSATTALNVTNSAGSSLFLVRGDGALYSRGVGINRTSNPNYYLPRAGLALYSTGADIMEGVIMVSAANAQDGAVATNNHPQVVLQNGFNSRQGFIFANNGSLVNSSFGMISENTALTFKTASYTMNVSDLVTGWTERMRLDASGNVGIGTTAPTARLQVQGAGSTSATTALRVTNSSGTSLFSVRDDGVIQSKDQYQDQFSMSPVIGSYVDFIQANSGGGTASYRVTIFATRSDTVDELTYYIGANHAIGGWRTMHPERHIEYIYHNWRCFDLDINQSGSFAVNVTFRLRVSRNCGTAGDYGIRFHVEAIGYHGGFHSPSTVVQTGAPVPTAIGSSASTYNLVVGPATSGLVAIHASEAGNVGIGTTAPTARLQVLGAGTTSATTALNVTNSSGTSLFSVRDDGVVTMTQSLIMSQGSSTRNVGVIGTYDPTRLAAIWSMGASYQIAANGTTGGNLYGLSYSYEPNYGATGNNPGAISGLSHQMQWRANGVTQTAIGSGIYTTGAIVAPEGTLRDDGGGWIRTYGATGWYNQTYQGGWFMQDTTWIRSYNNKSVYIAATLGTGGSVGIGTSAPAQKLHVVGGIRYSVATANTNTTVCRNSSGDLAGCSSLSSLKNNVSNLSLGLDDVMKLRPVSFEWNSYTNSPSNVRNDLGFIAEEVAAVSPLLGTYNETTGALEGVRYSQLTSLLTRAIQQQQTQISDLTQQIYQGIIVDPNFNWDNTNKRLGIGTTTTNSRLTVRGAGSTLSTSSLDIQNSLANSLLFVRDDGWIGIGTTDPQARLDVRGGVRVGEDSSSCSSSNSGTIRYDQSTNSLQVCNEKEWITFSSVANGSSIEQAAVSCEYIKIYYPTLPNGMFWIDPDGTGNIEPSQVYCELTSGS